MRAISPVINIGLLLVCAAFAQSFKSEGGENLIEEDMWGDNLMNRVGNHAQITAVLPGTCFACKRIMNKVRAKLDGDNDRDSVSAKLDSICASLGMLKGICKKLVNKYKEQLIDEIVSDDGIKDACKKLKLCK